MSTSWQEAADAIEEKTTIDVAEIWKPNAGEAIAGRVMKIARNTGSDGNSSLVELEREDGSHVGIWLSVVLVKQFEDLDIGLGDIVGVKFFGFRGTGNQYRYYETKILRRKATEDGLDFEDDTPF